MIRLIVFSQASLINSDYPSYYPSLIYSLERLKELDVKLLAITRDKLGEIEGYFNKIYYLSPGDDLEKSIEKYLRENRIDRNELLLFKENRDDSVYYKLLQKGLIPPAELYDALDRQGRFLGFKVVRTIPLPRNCYHLVVEVLVEHLDGSILLMRRSLKKKKSPGLWEASASGSVLAGESSLVAAKRELQEETGIDRGNLTFLGKTVIDELGAIYHNYHCMTDFDKDRIRLQEGETMDYKWIGKGKLKSFLASSQALAWQKQRYETFGII